MTARNRLSKNGRAALKYAALGWPVLPIHTMRGGHCSCADPACEHPAKHPFARFAPKGVKNATTDPQTIRRWYEEVPDLNVGIALGEPSGIVALDIDVGHKDGADGTVELARLEETHGSLPPTARERSGGGGSHYFFRWNGAPIPAKREIAPGVELRGTGGYLIVAPSCHASGKRYERCDRGSQEVIADPPPWLLSLPSRASVSKPEPRITSHSTLDCPPKGMRHDKLRNLAMRLARLGLDEAELRKFIIDLAKEWGFFDENRGGEVENIIVSALLKASKDAPTEDVDWVPSTFEGVLDERAGAIEWVAREFIPRGGTTLLAAEYKTAKTLLIYQAAFDLARGKPVLGRFMVDGPKRVLVFQLEMPAREDDRRFRRLAKGAKVDPPEIVRLAREGKLVVYNRVPLDLLSPEGVERFHEVVRRHDAEVVIIDSALAACSQSESTESDPMNHNPTVRRMFTRAILPLTSEGRSVIVLTHKRKHAAGKTDDPRGAMIGAQAWGAAADLIYSLNRISTKQDAEKRADHGFACSLSLVGAWTPESMRDLIVRVRDTDDGGTIVEALDLAGQIAVGGFTKTQKAHVALAELVRRESKVEQREAIARVAKELKLTPRTVEKALAELIASGDVKQEEGPGRAKNAKVLVSVRKF
jgi:KaiC/GvpD/RAD55 family RecA-like ATPase